MLNWNLSRREMLKLGAAGVLTTSFSGWLNRLAVHAAQTGQTPHKRCILLWMDGGPSHKDTFDLRPGTDNGGPYRAIDTSVAGIQISEHLPQFARLVNYAAIIRSACGMPTWYSSGLASSTRKKLMNACRGVPGPPFLARPLSEISALGLWPRTCVSESKSCSADSTRTAR